jgi:hypothetical protein
LGKTGLMTIRLLVLAAAGVMAGCALFPGLTTEAEPAPTVAAEAPSAAAEQARESGEVAALLAYYQDLLGLPAEELRREYQQVSQGFSRDRSELGRLRLVLLMCVPGAPWRDDVKLLALLEGSPSRKAAPESPRRQFVTLLQKLVAERQREQKRADELQQKLDSMIDIERKMRERQSKPK